MHHYFARFLPLALLLAACTTKTVKSETGAEPTDSVAEEPAETETPAAPEEDAGGGETTKPKPDPKPEVEDIAKVVLSGKFSNVDLEYARAGKYIVLTMNGKASGLSSSSKDVSPSTISVLTTTSYELLYPAQGACDTPPELSINKGALQLKLERAGEPNGTISGCYYLAGGVKASDGGFQARLENVALGDGRKLKELLLDVMGPTN